MIEINLLPEELRLKVRAKAKKEPSAIAGPLSGPDKKKLLLIAPLLIAILVAINVLLAGLTIAKNNTLSSLNKKWSVIQPQLRELENLSKEYSAFSEDAQAANQIIAQRVLWSQKLNKLSLYLPGGIWFKELSSSGENFSLQGSVVSLQKEEMGLLNKFIDSLKSDVEFFRDFNSLEISSVTKKTAGGYDIADFTLQGALKAK